MTDVHTEVSDDALLTGALELLIRVKLAAPDVTLYDRLALLKAQCLDEDGVYEAVVVERGYDPLERSSIRRIPAIDRERQKR